MWNTSTFGITQNYISQILKDLKKVFVHKNAIIFMSDNNKEHLSTLDTILETLMSNGIKVRLQKEWLFTKEINYSGYIFSSDGIRLNSNELNTSDDFEN